MKTLLKIKRIDIYPNDETVIILYSGYEVMKHNEHYVNMQTGEVYEPIFDEFKNRLIGCIG